MSAERRPYASTTCLEGHGYVETFEAYEAAGVHRVELGYCPVDVDVGELVESFGFDFAAHNYFLPREDDFVLNLASQDDAIRRRSVSYVCEAAEFCDRHDIGLYTFHAGFRADPSLSLEFPREAEPYERCFESFVDSLTAVVERTRDADVELAVENNVVAPRNVVGDEPLVLLCDPGEVERLFDRIDEDEVGLLLDTGHLNVSASTRGYDPSTFVDEVVPYLSAFHLHANDGQSDQHRPVARGDDGLSLYRRFPDVPTSVEAKFESATDLADHLDALARVRSER